MKIYLTLLLSFTIISCASKSDNSHENTLTNSLNNLEKELYLSPSTLLDSLKSFNIDKLENRNLAYYNLLYAIAEEQTFGVFKEETLTIKAAQEFKRNKDNLNFCRALLYTSIAQYYKNKQDSAAYNNLRLVETLLDKYNIEDNNLYATLHLYLGRYYRANSDSEIAKKELEQSLIFGKKAKNKTTILNASLEIFNINILNKKYKEAINTISYFGDVEEIPPYIAHGLYKSTYNYYSAKKEYKIAIEYLNKTLQIDPAKLKIKTNKPHTYYQLSLTFKKLNMADSSLHYAKAAVQSISDSSAQGSHFYYRYLADILYEKGEYKKASELYKTAHLTYIFSFTRLIQQRDQEFKTKFNFEEQKRENNLIQAQRAVTLNILFVFIALSIIVSLSYFFNYRRNNHKTYNLKKELNALRKEYNSNWIISEIYKTNSSILPQLIENVSQEAARSRKVSKEIYYSLNKIVDIANIASRASITDIANHPEFDHIFGASQNLDSLTDFEKLVYALNEVGYSNVQIAHFLNSSQSSIRTIKGKITRKFKNPEGNIEVDS